MVIILGDAEVIILEDVLEKLELEPSRDSRASVPANDILEILEAKFKSGVVVVVCCVLFVVDVVVLGVIFLFASSIVSEMKEDIRKGVDGDNV